MKSRSSTPLETLIQRIVNSSCAVLWLFSGVAGIADRAWGQVGEQKAVTIRVDANRNHVVNSFDPDRAFGTSLDVQPYGVIDKIFTPQVLKEMLSTGWGPITYRNNTELRISAWHWYENGVWSDPVHKSGYWVSSSEPADPIRYILSYSLPHRGFSQSGDGASSVMSGGSLSYWKSNPYLTSRFTGE